MRKAREIARPVGLIHNISYYAPEMRDFAKLGLTEYWRAYMAYRSAPMGRVDPAAVAAVFYNFAPSRVAEGLPSAWDTTTPEAAIELRDDCIARAMQRALGETETLGNLEEAAELLRVAMADLDASGRMLFAGHQRLEWPQSPLMTLWHGCTLWREYRGDGHNIALAAAGIDGVECHVLLAAKGVGAPEVITKIRGWTEQEWRGAVARLVDRGLVERDGSFTTQGKELRSAIEAHTDNLASAPCERLGAERLERLLEILTPVANSLVESGAVAGRWPPPPPVQKSVGL